MQVLLMLQGMWTKKQEFVGQFGVSVTPGGEAKGFGPTAENDRLG